MAAQPAASSREPVDAPSVTDSRAANAFLTILVLEQGTHRPMPEVALEATLFNAGEYESVQLPIAPDGRAFLAAEHLLRATGLSFAAADPELGAPKYITAKGQPRELLQLEEPFRILIPRGGWREFEVVDRNSRPIHGALMENYALRSASTDGEGRGRVRMCEPAPTYVDVWAAGYRVETVLVPPESEAWRIELQRAGRLEFTLKGALDSAGYHLELQLSAAMTQRTFYQAKYVQTPGRPRGGTPGRWSTLRGRQGSTWSLGFTDSGLAVLDQIYDEGSIEVQLLYFDQQLETRTLLLPKEGKTQRIRFEVPAESSSLAGLVLDLAGAPIPGVTLRMAPIGGRATIDHAGLPGFPVWAPSTETDAHGAFRLPAPRSSAEVVVFSKEGSAYRAMSVAEIYQAQQRVLIEPGQTVVVEVRDRNGDPIDGGWSSGDSYLHVRPSALIAHDVWRDVTRWDHPIALRDKLSLPFFLFTDLPKGVVRFRFSYLSDDEILLHDTSTRAARFVSSSVLDELGIGK
ncbi:MAG: hypothetical protein ACI8QS_002907 [Planctomycetota bacterium]